MHTDLRSRFIQLLHWRKSALALPLIALLLLTSCGFQLRGWHAHINSLIKAVTLVDQTENFPDHLNFMQLLQNQLINAQIKVLKNATWLLKINSVTYSERTVGYGGSGGNQEHEITAHLNFSLQQTQGHAYIISGQELFSRGTYNTSAGQLLQRDQQRDNLIQQLNQDLISQLLIRLQALDNQQLQI